MVLSWRRGVHEPLCGGLSIIAPKATSVVSGVELRREGCIKRNRTSREILKLFKGAVLLVAHTGPGNVLRKTEMTDGWSWAISPHSKNGCKLLEADRKSVV